MPASWSSDELDYKAELVPWIDYACDGCGERFVATGVHCRCPRCGITDVTPA